LLAQRAAAADLGRELDLGTGVKGRTTSLGWRISRRSQSSWNSTLENRGPLRTGKALQYTSSSALRLWTSVLER
jgi:hypothetical protein